MSDQEYHHVCVVGAGAGGISSAIALIEKGIPDVIVLDRGQIGQSWLDYPPETRLLSESNNEKDDNMIADVRVWDVHPNIPHPNHVMYQKYLAEVAKRKNVTTSTDWDIISVSKDDTTQRFVLHDVSGKQMECDYLVWATGMYSTPDEQLACDGCFIHYSKIQDWQHITDSSVTVIGGANGASEVVIQMAKPDRKVLLICSKEFDVPKPIDCLWKENRQLIKDLENQGLVEIVENFRVKKIFHDDIEFIIESTEGKIIRSSTKPIVCIGFLPNIGPIEPLINVKHEGHDIFVDLDEFHQSKKTPRLFCAGTIGKLTHDQAFIKDFRSFGALIAQQIQ